MSNTEEGGGGGADGGRQEDCSRYVEEEDDDDEEDEEDEDEEDNLGKLEHDNESSSSSASSSSSLASSSSSSSSLRPTKEDGNVVRRRKEVESAEKNDETMKGSTVVTTTISATKEKKKKVLCGSKEEEEEDEKSSTTSSEASTVKSTITSSTLDKKNAINKLKSKSSSSPTPPATRRNAPSPALSHSASGAKGATTTAFSSNHKPATQSIKSSPTTSKKSPPSNSSMPSTNDDDKYYKHWSSLQSLTAKECECSEIAEAYGCEAKRHHRGQRGWAGVLSGGIIGMFDTKEEAIKRVVCAALMMNDFESNKKTSPSSSITPLAKTKKSRAKIEATKLYTTVATKHKPPMATPASGTTKLASVIEPASNTVSTASSSPPNKTSSKVGDKANPISITSSSPPNVIANTNNTPINPSKTPTRTIPDTKPIPSTSSTGTGSGTKKIRAVTLGKRKWKTRNADGKVRHCEMSDIDTGHILEVFRSCSQAERETKISRTYIGKVCRHGGGILNGRYFRFVYLNPNEVEEHISKKSKKMDKNDESLSIDDDDDDDDYDDDNGIAATDTFGSTSYQDQQQRAGTFSYSLTGSSGIADESEKDNKNDGNNNIVSESLKNDDDYDVKMGAVRNESPGKHKRKQSFFDLSVLLPIKKKQKPATRPKKLIELVELSTGKVVVNFRGNADAGQALNIDRKKVGLACQSYGRRDEISYGTFKLRYAKTGTKPIAYEYGAHEIDFQHIVETHEERKVRFQRMFEADLRKGGGSVAGGPNPSPLDGVNMDVYDASGNSVIAIDSAVQETGEGGGDSEGTLHSTIFQGNTVGAEGHSFSKGVPNQTSAVNALGADAMVRVSDLVGDGNDGNVINNNTRMIIDGRTLVATRKPSTREMDSLCVVCQEKRANVVFEPCLHCVVCASCVEKGCCGRFCPSCRWSIENRTRPSMVHLIRPRIYSAYSFM